MLESLTQAADFGDAARETLVELRTGYIRP